MMLHLIQVCLIDKSVCLLVGKQCANPKSHNYGKKGIKRHNKGLTLDRALALISQRFFIMISSLKSRTNPSCFQQCAINMKQKDMVSSYRICTKSRGIHLHCRSTVLVSIHVQWFPCADGFFLHNMHKLQLEVQRHTSAQKLYSIGFHPCAAHSCACACAAHSRSQHGTDQLTKEALLSG